MPPKKRKIEKLADYNDTDIENNVKTSKIVSKKVKSNGSNDSEVDDDFEDSKPKLVRKIQAHKITTEMNAKRTSKRNVKIENPLEDEASKTLKSESNMERTSKRNIKTENLPIKSEANIDEIKEIKPSVKRTKKVNVKTENPPASLDEANKSALKANRPKKKVNVDTDEIEPSVKRTRKINVKTENPPASLDKAKKSVPKANRAKKKVNVEDETCEREPELPVISKNALVSVDRHLKTRKYVGAHTSIAGGLYKAIEEAEELGAVAIGMFLKSQRTWKSKELDEKSIKLFKEKMESSGFLPEMIIPHGSYLLNCGSANPEILQKSRDCLVDELKRCELLGIPMYNFHPGSAKDSTSDKCIDLIAETINVAHSQTKSVITLIENMSNQGSTVGGEFVQLKAIIDKVKDKSRVGICFDTCHAFAAGYDLRSEEGYEKTKKEFDEIVGRKYLKAVHLNDSKGDVGCHLDRHENVGRGKLGLNFFKRIMNDPFFNDVAMVLETPEGDYKAEIDLLYSLCD